MSTKKTIFLIFALWLALLQGVLPFLHAHSGLSSKTGFHLHFSPIALSDRSTEATVHAIQDSDSAEVAITNIKDPESEPRPFPLTQWLYAPVAIFFLVTVYLSPIFWRSGWLFSLPIKKYSSSSFWLPSLAPPQTYL